MLMENKDIKNVSNIETLQTASGTGCVMLEAGLDRLIGLIRLTLFNMNKISSYSA